MDALNPRKFKLLMEANLAVPRLGGDSTNKF
jgi:hypothetical protein